jgi:predicted  nucleic acid-binding Zn-ribbon protein
VTNSYQVSNVTDDQIRFFLAQKMINPEIDQALRKIIAQKNSVAALDAEVASRKSKISGISDDQQRVRENMKALKGSAEEKTLVARYVRELNEQEDRVQSLHHEMADLQQKREAAEKTLNDMIEGLQMDATL